MMRYQGYSGADVTKVCRDAGVARAHFYRLIPGKQGLGLAALTRLSEERFALIDAALAGDGGLSVRITRVFAALYEQQLAAQAEQGRAPGSVFAGFTASVNEPEILNAVEEVLAGCRSRLRAAIAAAHTPGAGTEADASASAAAIVALIEGGLHMAHVSDDPKALLDLVPSALAVAGIAA